MDKEELKKLLQIQELEFVLRETDVAQAANKEFDAVAGREEVNKKIEAIRTTVAKVVLKHYDGNKKNGIGVAMEQDGRCRACHMTIPGGLLNNLKTTKSLPVCPNCSVILCLSEGGK